TMVRTYVPALLVYVLSNSYVSGLVTQSRTIVVRTGVTITLQCSNVSMVVGHTAWFKQVNGSEPVCLSTMYSSHPSTFSHKGFKSSHLEIYSNNTTIFLKITNVDSSDSGLYFCGMFPQSYMVFVNATFLKDKPLLTIVFPLSETTIAFTNLDVTGTWIKLSFRSICFFKQYLHVLCNIIICFLQDPGQDPDSLNYVALRFSQKRTRNKKTAKGLIMEMEHVVYAATK
uniref:Ig-like domain-containing protein n=1 Tax=Salmo trutta TaxID=8032 RepID=A0A673VVJ5_SALTR